MVSGPDSRSSRQPSGRRNPAGDQLCAQEFGTLFKSSYGSLRSIALGIVQDATLAEDVVQEAALVALGKLREFRTGSCFYAWMARIVQYVALNHSRARRRRKTVPLAVANATPVAQPAAPACLAGGHFAPNQPHFDDRVLAALGRVPAPARACLLLRTIEGLEYAEIARQLNIPPGTAMSHVHRTRQLLRQALADLAPPATATILCRENHFSAMGAPPGHI